MELTLTAEPYQEPDGEPMYVLWCGWCHGRHVIDRTGWLPRLPCWRDNSPYADGVEVIPDDVTSDDGAELWVD